MISVPWASLAADNHRLMPVRMGKMVRLITAPAYREAKAQIERCALLQWRAPRLTGPGAIHGVFWFPDRRRRDVGNYGKCLQDALTGLVYDDDSQLHDVRWTLGGIDRMSPRVEITVTALAP